MATYSPVVGGPATRSKSRTLENSPDFTRETRKRADEALDKARELSDRITTQVEKKLRDALESSQPG